MPTFECMIRTEVLANRLPRDWTTADLRNNHNILHHFALSGINANPANYSINLPGRVPDLGAGNPVANGVSAPLFYRVGGPRPLIFRLINEDGPVDENPPIGNNIDNDKDNEPLEDNLGLIAIKNIILYGPPGTGKTYALIDYAFAIVESIQEVETNYKSRVVRKSSFDIGIDEKKIRFVTFHQSFGYEEFVEGIRANTDNGNIHYDVKDGVFKSICVAANNDINTPYILIIDEINRGNISKIFGELITLIEPSKRTGEPEQLSLTLPYSGEIFSVPNNLYIIGTMNTADRSLALIDTALRRRFDFIEMQPQPDLLAGINVQGVNIEQMLTRMNQRIEVLYDREHTLGHAFFMHLSNASPIDALAEVFKLKIIPLLQEYFFEDWEKIRIVLGDDQKAAGIEFITRTTIPQSIFSPAVLGSYRLQNVVTYSINPIAFTNPASYQQIYS